MLCKIYLLNAERFIGSIVRTELLLHSTFLSPMCIIPGRYSKFCVKIL